MRVFIGALLLVLTACNYSDKKTTTDAPADIENNVKEKDYCFAWTNNKDSIYMTLRQNGSQASGKLDYFLFEKDSNKGSYTGSFRGDTLFGDYEFQSEGQTSYRQVAFIRNGETFTELYGESEEKNGRFVFKDQSALKPGSIILGETSCR